MRLFYYITLPLLCLALNACCLMSPLDRDILFGNKRGDAFMADAIDESLALKKNNPPLSAETFEAVGQIYDRMLTAMTKDFCKRIPQANPEDATAFVIAQVNREKFISDITQNEFETFQTGRENPKLRKQRAYKNAREATLDKAIIKAHSVINTAQDEYCARFILKDNLLSELYDMEATDDNRSFILMVREELKGEELQNFLNSIPNHEKGDRVFLFSSSEKDWKQFCGVGGYILVRGRQIVAVVTTHLN